MKKAYWLLVIAIIFSSCKSETSTEEKEKSEPTVKKEEKSKVDSEKTVNVNLNTYDDLLKKFVSEKGDVDYGGFLKNRKVLDGYIDELSKEAPKKIWSKDKEMAYWINMYNANTIKLILNNADKNIKSIKDIGPKNQIPFVNTPWDIKFIEIEGDKYDLNKIEHGTLRKKFKKDPRFHFAIVCASKSCPQLRNEIYTADKLDKQLEDQADRFINDEYRNQISANSIKPSNLFKWYKKDFEREMSIAEWINKYSSFKIPKDKSNFNYVNYSWELNGTF